jgi:hypothetical protein
MSTARAVALWPRRSPPHRSNLTLIAIDRAIELTIGLEVHHHETRRVGVRQVYESLDDAPVSVRQVTGISR